MKQPARLVLRKALLVAAIAAAASGCGQRGPLMLPDDARPIERLPQPTTPTAPQSDEEEQRNER